MRTYTRGFTKNNLRIIGFDISGNLRCECTTIVEGKECLKLRTVSRKHFGNDSIKACTDCATHAVRTSQVAKRERERQRAQRVEADPLWCQSHCTGRLQNFHQPDCPSLRLFNRMDAYTEQRRDDGRKWSEA